MVAATVGAFAVAAALPRTLARRAGGIATVAVVAGLGFWIQSLPQPPAHVGSQPAPAPPAAKPGYLDAEVNFPRNGELGIPPPGANLRRRLVTSSGRLQAWGGAVRQAEQRPVAGFGFGTESRVFVDRWSQFVGSVPENSYIGLALELGIAGLVVFAALVAAVGGAGLLALRGGQHNVAIACLGIVAAGLVIAFVQSYFYSVGNIGTVTLWIAFLLVPAAAEATTMPDSGPRSRRGHTD
jgi:hypothetical protein